MGSSVTKIERIFVYYHLTQFVKYMKNTFILKLNLAQPLLDFM